MNTNNDRFWQMNSTSEYIWYLKFRISVLSRQVESFRSGSAMQRLRHEYETVIHKLRVENNELKKEVTSARNETVTSRKAWSEIFEDLEKERLKDEKQYKSKIKQLEKRILEVERQRDDALDKLKSKREECYQVQTELEEERGKNAKLTAQVNKDFQNSSIPSSLQGPGRKKIPNSREKTGRKRGGQVGHQGHRLNQRTPDQRITLPDPEEYKDPLKYAPTNKYERRQMIVIEVKTKVVEYLARVYRHRETGSRVHAPFPAGCKNDVNYDGSVKAFAFLLANECNVSAAKVRNFIKEISNGGISISEATINGLVEEFSSKTESEKKEQIQKLLNSPVLNVDFTNANLNGTAGQVLIIASPTNGVMTYIARDSKGHKGIQGTLLEQYVGSLVHDHDKTFYSYGMRHQECMQHNTRYLKGSIENEPDRNWNKEMLELVRKMLHYRNSLPPGENTDPATVQHFEEEYDRILEKAREEYEYVPPNDYYREGYNLYIRLVEYKENELLFLHDINIPANNSLAERLARVFKRKQKQMMVLRSTRNFEFLCDDLGITQTLKINSANLYDRVSEIFMRPRYRSRKDAMKPIVSENAAE